MALKKNLKSQLKCVLRWNSWTAFFVEVSRHKRSLLRLEFLSDFLPSYFYSRIDSILLLSRIFFVCILQTRCAADFFCCILGPWATAIHWRAVKNSLRGTPEYSLVFFKIPPVERLPRAWSKRLKMMSKKSISVHVSRFCPCPYSVKWEEDIEGRQV